MHGQYYMNSVGKLPKRSMVEGNK